jgi:uncharacterized protein (TIGR03437 family)
MRILQYILWLLALAAVALGQNSSFAFTYEIGGSVPAAQTWYLTSQAPGDPISGLEVAVTSGQTWLVASLSSPVSPSTLTILVNPLGLPAGSYSGALLVTSSSGAQGLSSSVVSVALTVRYPAVSITNVTNAALPSLDVPAGTVALAPRSLATIYGMGLADTSASATASSVNALGGTEVHLASDTCFDSSCEIVADLIYVCPYQINFRVPDQTAAGPTAYRVVFVRDGQRFDNQNCIQGGPGCMIVDPSGKADYNVVFQVGYDCLFSASLSDPTACGLSWVSGPDRAPVGAVADALTGELITNQNPVYQGRLITLWMTGLYGGVTFDSATGLRTANTIVPVEFGVAQSGTDLTTSFVSPMPLWAGESPQFEGLDQVNVAFPTCTNAPAATAKVRHNACATCTTGPGGGAGTETQYDAFLAYTNEETGTAARIYIPFVVRQGDPPCSW